MATTRPSRARKVLAALLVVLGLVVVAVGVRLYLALPVSWPTREFSPAAWAASPRQERFRLYKDLARKRLLERESREAVIRLLGAPDYQSPGGEYVQYVLIEARPENQMLNALYLLQVEFDSAGLVSRYIVRHE